MCCNSATTAFKVWRRGYTVVRKCDHLCWIKSVQLTKPITSYLTPLCSVILTIVWLFAKFWIVSLTWLAMHFLNVNSWWISGKETYAFKSTLKRETGCWLTWLFLLLYTATLWCLPWWTFFFFPVELQHVTHDSWDYDWYSCHPL